MDELLDLTFDWFAARTHFRVGSSVYGDPPGNDLTPGIGGR